MAVVLVAGGLLLTPAQAFNQQPDPPARAKKNAGVSNVKSKVAPSDKSKAIKHPEGMSR